MNDLVLNIFLFVAGAVIGFISNVIVTKYYRKIDIREQAWEYVFERAGRCVDVKTALDEALYTKELAKFEDLMKIIRQGYENHFKKEFKFISEEQKKIVDEAILKIIQLVEPLSLYITYSRHKTYDEKYYAQNKNEVEQKLYECFKKMELLSENMTSRYDELLVDKCYYK